LKKRKSHVELNNVYFWTSSIKDHIPLLGTDSFKEIIISSLQYLVNHKKIKVYAFVIMPHTSFHKFTAHQFLKIITNFNPFKVIEDGRAHRFWQRDALAILIDGKPKCEQKLDYIHLNPLQEKWSLVKYPEDYRWSSASYYELGKDEFNIITDYRNRL